MVTSLKPIETEKLDLKFYKFSSKRRDRKMIYQARVFITDLINKSYYFDPGFGVGFAIFYEDKINLVILNKNGVDKRTALYDLRRDGPFNPNYPAINKFNTTETGRFRDFELLILMHEEESFAEYDNVKDKKI